MGAAHLIDADTFEQFEKQVILSSLHDLLGGGQTNYTGVEHTIAARIDRYWAQSADRSYAQIYAALSAGVVLFRLRDKYANGMIFHSAAEMFRAYCDELFRFDQAYRRIYAAAMRVKHGIDILKNHLLPAVENYYRNTYLPELAVVWGKLIEEELVGDWAIEGVPRQTAFYKEFVMPILSARGTSRAFIIVSDALRYEVASSEPAHPLCREQLQLLRAGTEKHRQEPCL